MIELLVASVVVSVALLGVFSLMRQASQVEVRAQEVWRSRGHAGAIADHIGNALKQSVVVSNTPGNDNDPNGSSGGDSGGGGIQAGLDDSGEYYLRFFALGGVYDHGLGEPLGGIRWLEYRWFRESSLNEGAVGDSDRVPGSTEGATSQASSFKVELRSVLLAGETLLSSPPDRPSTESLEEFDWDQIEPVTLATGLDEVELSFRPMPDGQWQSEFEGSPADVLVRLRIRVGNETVERLFYPRAMPDPAAQTPDGEESTGSGAGGANP